MKKSCVGCKYNYRSDKKEPCKTGVWNIYYSGECLQYKPSLKTKLKKQSHTDVVIVADQMIEY